MNGQQQQHTHTHKKTKDNLLLSFDCCYIGVSLALSAFTKLCDFDMVSIFIFTPSKRKIKTIPDEEERRKKSFEFYLSMCVCVCSVHCNLVWTFTIFNCSASNGRLDQLVVKQQFLVDCYLFRLARQANPNVNIFKWRGEIQSIYYSIDHYQCQTI